MAVLGWKESYCTGIKSLDDQHRRLLDLINEFSAMSPSVPDKKRIFTALNALADYAQTHFETEEKYLKEYGYAGLAQQQREHIAFTADVFRLAQELDGSDQGVHGRVLDFMKSWFISHVLGTDREYIDFLLSKRVT